MTASKLFVQLWSLRRETASDARAVLSQLKDWGYDGVELAGDYGWPAEEWREVLAASGLEVVGAHVGLADLESKLHQHITFQQTIGNSRLVVPSLPGELQTQSGYRDVARRLSELGQHARAHGCTLHYHNHAFEFTPLPDGSCGMDILLADTAVDALQFECDTHWIAFSGRDPVAFLESNSARVSLVHAKEFRAGDRKDGVVGQGDLDFPAITSLAGEHSWPVIVEYEGENAPEVLRESAAYLRGLARQS